MVGPKQISAIFLSIYLVISMPCLGHGLPPCDLGKLGDVHNDLKVYREKRPEALPADQKLSLYWQVSQEGLRRAEEEIKFSESLWDTLATGLVAHEHVFLLGDPGGAKSASARMLLEAELKSISDEEKRVFAIQFDKLMTDGVITGFPRLKTLMQTGLTEINTDSALAGEKFLFTLLDELEKANPATLAALLSILNERRAFLGDRVVDVALLSAFANSNKTLAEFLASFEDDRPTGEALLDRFLLKYIAPGQTKSATEDFALAKLWMQKKGDKPTVITALHQLRPLIDRVTIPESSLHKMANVLLELDGQFTKRAKEIREASQNVQDEYVPASQFSIRSHKGYLKMMKASFLVDQLRKGVKPEDIRFEMKDRDLVHLAYSGAIYGGPGRIQEQRIPVKGNIRGRLGTVIPDTQLEIDPHNLRVLYWTQDDLFKPRSFPIDPKTHELLDDGLIADEATRTLIKDELAKVNFDLVQYEVSPDLQRAIDMPGLKSRMKTQFETVLYERNQFVQQLNAALEAVPNEPARPAPRPALPIAKRHRYQELKNLSNRSQYEEMEKAWLEAQLFLDEATRAYRGLEYKFSADFVSLLTKNHMFLYGPAGGAKTATARHFLDSVINGLREDGADASLFFLQMNKLTPQSRIVGSPKIGEQLDSGDREYEVKGSMVDPRHPVAIVDEVEKGAPPVTTKFLSVLNERKAMHGSQEMESKNETTIMTSNKTPSEFLDSFYEDRSTGDAILARALNKVYISNKFLSADELTDFYRSLQNGAPEFEFNTLHVQNLRPLLDKVTIPDAVLRLATDVRREFLDKESKKGEDSLLAKLNGGSPYAMEPANYGSTRSLRADLEQWKAALIVQQLARGVDLADVRFTMEPRDVVYLAQGLTYWAPWRPLESDQHGIIRYELGQEIDQYLSRDFIDERQKFMLKGIKEGAQEFLTILNNHYLKIALQVRKYVTSGGGSAFSRGLIKNPEEYKQWVKTQTGEE